MAASSVLALVLFVFCIDARVVAQGKTIIARTGDDVTLPCFAPKNVPVRAAEWYVNGEHQSYVYSWRGGTRPDVENQRQQYEGRVRVKNLEEEKKEKRNDTDLSLTINNVTPRDSGTYECHISNGTVDHSVRDTSFGTRSFKTVSLVVVDDIITTCPGDDVPLACDPPTAVDAEDPVCSCVRDRQPGVSVDCRMSHGNISVVKKNVKPDDSGVYVCSSAGGLVQKTLYVNVILGRSGRRYCFLKWWLNCVSIHRSHSRK